MLLSKVTVLILLVTSPGEGLGELFGPRFLRGAGAQFLLVLLTHTDKQKLDHLGLAQITHKQL